MMKERGAQNVASNLKRVVPKVVQRHTLGQLGKLLQGRADLGSIGKWRRGERPVPQWARDMLATHLSLVESEARAEREELEKEKAPGRKAGARNLAIWRAANPAR